MKEFLKPYPAVFPVPALLLTVYDEEKKRSNIITIAWAGNVCSEPPMVSVSVRPTRYSNQLIKKEMEFVLNIPTAEMIREVDICGTVSGNNADKFELTGLTPLAAQMVKGHWIKECPVNIEARVKQIINLGVHDLFLAEVLGVFVDAEYLDSSKRRPDYEKINALAYCPERYVVTGSVVGRYGFTIKED
ncbi:MAG: flavin reductase family protein [Actinobacteria bacterium]|nr:flavin reductase family protein [Actinomycetota bacterium]